MNYDIHRKKPFKLHHLTLLIVLILSSGIGLLWLFQKSTPYPNEEFYLILCIYFIIIGVSAFALKTSALPKIHHFLGFKRAKLKHFIIAIIGTVTIWAFDYFLQLSLFSADFTQEANDWLVENQTTALWTLYLTICLMTPIVEEMLFRGVILQCLNNYLSVFWSVLIASVSFALIHASFPDFATLFLAAVFYSWLSIKSNSLLPAIVAHALNNSLTFLFYLKVSA